MVFVQKITRTELARSTRRVLDNVQRGRAALIEKHGQPEAAILDILDYYILQGIAQYHARSKEINPKIGLNTETVEDCEGNEEVYILVMLHYLARAISLSRAAELLEVPALELRARFQRLGIPIRTEPKDNEAVLSDVEALASL